MGEPKDWWDPREITFAGDDWEEQILWLLKHKATICAGEWPPEGVASGYVGEDRARSQKAPFETPVQVCAELSARLEATGLEGKLLLSEVRAGISVQFMQEESRRALRYMRGSKRKELDYLTWKRQRRYRGENDYENVIKLSRVKPPS